ncbi:MAG: hypothetical protein ACHP6H_02125 [Legionellales bacterium]
MANDNMRPQDIAVLLKIVSYKGKKWMNKDLAGDLYLSTAEISNSLKRSIFSGLIDEEKKKIRKQAFIEFLIYGVPHVFPPKQGGITRGMLTAYSHPFLKERFVGSQLYVWPDADSEEKGFSVQPLYPGAVKGAKKDNSLYLLLALTDVLRMGKAREKKIAISELKRLINEPSD